MLLTRAFTACIYYSVVILLVWGKRVHLLSAACLIFLLSAPRIKKTRVMPRPASFNLLVYRALNCGIPYCTTISHMLSYEHRSPALAQMSLHDFLPWRRSRSCGLLLCFLLLRCIVRCGILWVRYCVTNHGAVSLRFSKANHLNGSLCFFYRSFICETNYTFMRGILKIWENVAWHATFWCGSMVCLKVSCVSQVKSFWRRDVVW